MRARPLRVPTPYPLPPALFVKTLLRAGRAAAGRRTGSRSACPGMIRHGVVVATPHYVTRTGPRSRVDPDLLAEWSGFDARGALAEAFGVPALVLNDAEVHGAGVVAGTGCELVLTLGTGLGSALFDGGRARPAPGAVARAGALGHHLRHVRRRAGTAAARRRLLVPADPAGGRRAAPGVPLGPALPRRRQLAADPARAAGPDGRRRGGGARTRPGSSAGSGPGSWSPATGTPDLTLISTRGNTRGTAGVVPASEQVTTRPEEVGRDGSSGGLPAGDHVLRNG